MKKGIHKEALEKDAQSIAIKAYEKIQKEQQAKSQAENGDNNNNNSGDDNTVDADYEDVK